VRAAVRGASGLPSERRHQFPTQFRLKRRADFQKVYRNGVRVAGRHVVIFLMRAEAHGGRFGVTASRHVGGAVARSRCKRRLRELYRTHRHEFEEFATDTVANARGSMYATRAGKGGENTAPGIGRGED
jgi:ribonuclease P protein component